MRNRFRFLSFVVVLLKVLAIVVLLGGVAVAILGLAGGPSGEGTLQSVLRVAAKIGGVVALVAGFFYFIVFWGISDLIRVLVSIEDNTRQTQLGMSKLEGIFSAEKVGRAVADAIGQRQAAERAWAPAPSTGTFRQAAAPAPGPAVAAAAAATVVGVPAAARETQATVRAIAAEPVVEKVTVVAPAVQQAAPKAAEALVEAVRAEPLVEKPAVVETAAIEEAVAVAETVLPEAAEEAIPESAAMLEEVAAETPGAVESVIEPAAADALQEAARQDAGPLPSDARVMTWTGDEGAEKGAPVGVAAATGEAVVRRIEEEGHEAAAAVQAAAEQLERGPQPAPEVVGSVMTWAGGGPAPQEEVADTEVAEPGAVPEPIADMQEARARAKVALDRSLGEAARQMAELEGPAPVVLPPAAAEDNLAEIAGIGPVFRVRLRQAGITTFAGLAAMTPTQLAAVTEQTVERITRDDWIGQAQRRLAVG